MSAPLTDLPFPLGRHVNHDPRSRNFEAVPEATTVRTKMHIATAPVLSQGQLSSCTGNALAQCLNTRSFDAARQGVRPTGYLQENDALSLYSEATILDSFPGSWPPEDTGSDGLSVCKVGVNQGYLTGYRHTFSFDAFLLALMDTPVLVGTSWTHDMFHPTPGGFVQATGDVLGGHEYLALGVNTEAQYVVFLNSWGAGWGRAGRFGMRFADVKTLLADSGDVTVPTANTSRL